VDCEIDHCGRSLKADAQLRACLEGAARGDDAAIVTLYSLAAAEYRRYAHRWGFDPDDVEDIVSEAFLSLLEELRTTDAWSANESWELIAHARRAANRRRNRREYGIDPETILASAVLPVDDWEEAQAEADRRDAEAEEEERRRSVLRRAIESSRPYPRYYLSLRLLDGRPPREISGITGEMPARITRRIRSLTGNLKNRPKGRLPHRSRSQGTASASCEATGSSRAVSPAPSVIRLLVEEFCSEHPDGSAAECLRSVTETTGFQLDRAHFYVDFWIRRRASRVRARGQDEHSPSRASNDFRLRDGRLRPTVSLTPGMRAQIRAFVLVLREDDPGVSAREAMRKAGEHHGVLFKDIHSFRSLYFSTHGYGQRIGKGSGGLRVLKGRTPEEVEAFVEEVLQRRPEATAGDVLRATNLALGTAIKAEAPFRVRYVAPVRRRLGIPNPPPLARGAWTPPCPPEGWRAAGTLSRDEREHVVAWLREQILGDGDASGAELFRRAREQFRVDWRGGGHFGRVYLLRARREPGPDEALVRRLSTEARKRIAHFIRTRLAEDASLGASRLIQMVNQRFGTGFSSPGSFRQRYVSPVRNELRDPAGSSSFPSHPAEPRMATPPAPAATSSPKRSHFVQRSSVYTAEQKTRGIEWLVQYITSNPRCTTTEARVAVQDAIQVRIAEGTFHNGFFIPALERCTPEIRALRGTRRSPSAPPATQRARVTDRQKARMRQMVACLKRDHPELLTNLPELMARATSLDRVHYNDVVAFRQHYVDPVAPAAPGDAYPEPMAATHVAPAPARQKPKVPPTAKAAVALPQPSASLSPPRDAENEIAAREPAAAPAAPPPARVSPLPANILAVLAADPVRAIRLEGVEGVPGHAKILMDIGPLAMADATRLYATLYSAVADVLS